MTKPDEPTQEELIKIRDALFQAVGNVASSWAAHEHVIDRSIWLLGSLSHKEGACITAQLVGLMPRMRALIALVRLKCDDEALATALNTFTTEAVELSQRRNRIVHDPWFYNVADKEPTRLQVTADRRLYFDYKTGKMDEIRAVSNRIAKATTRFQDLMKRAHAARSSSTKKRLELKMGKPLDYRLPDSEPEGR